MALDRPLIAPSPSLLAARRWRDYALLDSGGGRKLERCGPFRLVRPEAQCLWRPSLPEDAWAGADAIFEAGDEEDAGRWAPRGLEGETWPMAFEGLSFQGRFTAFRHIGFFPEQQPNWSWLKARLQKSPPAFRLLNLFAYTGVASLLAASCGAETTHLDASKRAIGWARGNAEAAGFTNAPIRWICDDAAKFVARERRRGASYEGIILDPPKYGRGPKGEIWRLLEGLPALLWDCAALLSKEAHFLLLNAYDERLSGPALASLMAEALEGRGGRIEWGELALFEEGGARAFGLSFFARWEGP